MLKTRILCIFLLGLLLCGCKAEKAAETTAPTRPAMTDAPAVTTAASNPAATTDTPKAPAEDTVQKFESAINHVEENSFLVWIPMHGGQKYHANHTCSEMDRPVHVSVETARANGYTRCERCSPTP